MTCPIEAFNETRRLADTMIAAIPEDISIEAECAAIEAATRPVQEMARRIIATAAVADHDHEAAKLARAWLDQ